MRIHGSCHCGQITYEAEVDPDSVRVCHCTDCQQLCGSPFRAVVVTPSDTFTLLTGEPKTYVKTADSGNKRSHAFCGNCGCRCTRAHSVIRRLIPCASARSANARSFAPTSRSGVAPPCPGR